jgi:hypothetical protein
MFPPVQQVFRVSDDIKNIDPVSLVENSRDEPAAIVLDIKNNAASHSIDTFPTEPNVLKLLPIGVPRNFSPGVQRSFPFAVFGNSLTNPFGADDPHNKSSHNAKS